jgi:CheY-like chemotaxis protein
VTRSGLPPATQRKVDEIRKAGDRAVTLVRQLLAFSRKQVLATKVLDLGALVTDFAKMLPRILREDVTLEIEGAPELGQVKADPGQLEQILMSLAVNARDAMLEGGTLRICTGNATLEEPVRRGQETILLVEDEDAVRVLVTDMLQGLGHTVLAADCGRAALEAADRHAGPIHLLLSNVVMPGLSGRQTAERLSVRHKETKVVYMSGHTDDILGARGVLDAETVLLSKPFGERALNQCLRAVLG